MTGSVFVPAATTRVFLALLRVYARDGRATVHSVMTEAGLASTASVHRHHLPRLRDAGLIAWEPDRKGTLRPTYWPVVAS